MAQTDDGFKGLLGEEIGCAIIIGGTIGFWITTLLTVFICHKVRSPKTSPVLEYVRLVDINSNTNVSKPTP